MQTASFFAPDASAEPSDAPAPVNGGQEEEGTERLLQLVCSLTERLTEVQEENQRLRSQLGAAAEPLAPLAGAGGQAAAQPAPLPGLPDALSTPMVSAHHCYVRGHRGARRTAD